MGIQSPAFAEHEHYYRHDYHGPAAPPVPFYHHQRPAPELYPHYQRQPDYRPPQFRQHERRQRSNDWVAPVALLAIAGLAVATLSQSARATPPPAVPAPPPPVRPATGNYWHYCPASGQYYPNVRHCDAPWQLVSANY